MLSCSAARSLGSIEHQVAGIISRARKIKSVLKAGGPEHDPDPAESIDDEPTEVEALRAQLEVAEGELARLRSERRRMTRLIERLAAVPDGADGADTIIDAEPDDDADDEGEDEGDQA